MNNSDLDIFALTLYGEAEANNIQDAEAIACVIMNRIAYPNWGSTVKAVCLQPWQFSCWNANDKGRERMSKPHKKWHNVCKSIAKKALDGELKDMTYKSTHYYATYVSVPKWAKNKKHVYEVKHRNSSHQFFNNIDTKAPKTAAESLEQQTPIAKTRTIKGAQVAAGATGLGVVAQAIEQASPAIPLIQTVAQYAPWVLFIATFAALAYMVYARFDDRKNGYR